jgi:hypothetical protein
VKRFLGALVVVAVFAGVIVSAAPATRFTDDPCPEAGGGGIRVCPGGLVDSSYSVQLDGAGGCGPGLPYQYRVINGALPSGLSLSSSGLISGRPTAAGTANFWIELSDQDPPTADWCIPKTAEREFTITINPGLTLSKDPLAPGTVGSPYSKTLSALLTFAPGQTQVPSSPLAWSIAAGALPPGLALGAGDGVLTGTPTTVGSYTFTVQAVLDAQRSDVETYTINVAQPVVITSPFTAPAVPPKSEVGVPFSATLTPSGGNGTFTWALAGGTLPTGVVFGTTDGTVSGTPRTAGRFPFSVTLTDSDGRTTTLNATLVVAAKLSIKTLVLRAGKVGRLYRAKLATLGGVLPTKWTILRGTLPRGVHFAKKMGVFLGTPRREGRYRVTVQVVDALGVKSQKTLVIVVNA